MRTKLWAALCALLLFNWGSADHNDDRVTVAPPSSGAPVTVDVTGSPAAHPAPTPDPVGHGGNVSDAGVTRSSAATEREAVGAASTPGEDHEKGVAAPTQAPSQTPHLTSDSPTSTRPPPPPPTTISGPHGANDSSANALTAPSSPSLGDATSRDPDAGPSSLRPNHTETPLAATSEPPNPEAPTAAAGTPSSSAPSPTSAHQPTTHSTHAPTSDSRHQESSTARTSSSTTTTATTTTTTTRTTTTAAATARASWSPTTQAKTHGENQSQLNVGGDPTEDDEDPPTSKSLLVGLLSALFIAAALMLLLVFFKTRRDNRPEFRRLQDLPMDDMMEDMPLSMYSF